MKPGGRRDGRDVHGHLPRQLQGQGSRHRRVQRPSISPTAISTSSARALLAKGLLKLVRPNPAIERSEFRVDADGLRPLEFWYEDGSRSGEDNLHIVFDWDRRVATVSTAAARRELALPDAARSIAAACKWR